MKKSEPKMFMNIAFESEEFEEKVKIAMDKYVEDVIYKNLDEEIMNIVDKKIDSLISANKWDSNRKIQGVTLEEFVKDRTEKVLGDFDYELIPNVSEVIAWIELPMPYEECE